MIHPPPRPHRPDPTEPEEGDRVPSASVNQRILIVDDDLDGSEALGLLFELDGHSVCLAHDGPSAVAKAAVFSPGIILMDMGLEGFDGVEAVRQIRAMQTDVRPHIIALTGLGADADRQASRNAGADLHLVKPVAYPDLSATIGQVGGASARSSAPLPAMPHAPDHPA